MQDQRGWLSSLHNAAPLFPLDLLTDHLAIKGSFVGLNVCPLPIFAKANALLCVHHPRFTKLTKTLREVFNGFVVDVKQTVKALLSKRVGFEWNECAAQALVPSLFAWSGGTATFPASFAR